MGHLSEYLQKEGVAPSFYRAVAAMAKRPRDPYSDAPKPNLFRDYIDKIKQLKAEHPERLRQKGYSSDFLQLHPDTDSIIDLNHFRKVLRSASNTTSASRAATTIDKRLRQLLRSPKIKLSQEERDSMEWFANNFRETRKLPHAVEMQRSFPPVFQKAINNILTDHGIDDWSIRPNLPNKAIDAVQSDIKSMTEVPRKLSAGLTSLPFRPLNEQAVLHSLTKPAKEIGGKTGDLYSGHTSQELIPTFLKREKPFFTSPSLTYANSYTRSLDDGVGAFAHIPLEKLPPTVQRSLRITGDSGYIGSFAPSDFRTAKDISRRTVLQGKSWPTFLKENPEEARALSSATAATEALIRPKSIPRGAERLYVFPMGETRYLPPENYEAFLNPSQHASKLSDKDIASYRRALERILGKKDKIQAVDVSPQGIDQLAQRGGALKPAPRFVRPPVKADVSSNKPDTIWSRFLSALPFRK